MPISFATQPAHLCYIRAAWADPWVEVPLLQCHQIHSVLAPSHSSARLSFRYGWAQLPAIGSRPADLSIAVVPRPDYLGYYVRVNVAGLGSWYGILQDQEDQQDGVLDGVATGIMSYSAFGVTRVLEVAEPITQAEIKTSGGTDRINWAVPFNGGSDGRRSRNRVAVGNYESTAKCFTDKTVTASPALWRARDAVEYLFAEFAPRDGSGTAQLTFIVGSASLDVLDYDLPMIPVHGKTIWQLLNLIVDRRRGLVWWFVVNGSEELELVVDSSATSAISLPSGGGITANRNQLPLDFSTAVNIRSASLATSALQQYDQVIAEGERIGVVFTVSPDVTTGQMIPDWSTAEEDAYNAAASSDTGYSGLSDTKRGAANADFRARDELARVFSWWRLRLDWDGKGRNEGGTDQPAIMDVDADGVVDDTTVGPFWLDGLRFESFIPLRPGIDYTGAVTPSTEAADEDQRDYLPPAVWLQLDPVNTESGSVDDGWIHCERLNAAVDAGDTTREYQWSVQVRAREDTPGLILEVTGGQQHFLAEDLYESNGAFEDIPANEGINARDWLATVYVLLQQCVRGVYPVAASVGGGDAARVLRLDVPDARLDYLVDGTVVGVASGELQQTSGGVLRDDSERVQDVARMAYEWYGQPRRALSLSFRAIAAGLEIGHLITTVQQGGLSQSVNTVISSISYNLDDGTTDLRTAFSEIDFAGVS